VSHEGCGPSNEAEPEVCRLSDWAEKGPVKRR
jgi:hypothetical protein